MDYILSSYQTNAFVILARDVTIVVAEYTPSTQPSSSVCPDVCCRKPYVMIPDLKLVYDGSDLRLRFGSAMTKSTYSDLINSSEWFGPHLDGCNINCFVTLRVTALFLIFKVTLCVNNLRVGPMFPLLRETNPAGIQRRYDVDY